MMAPASGETPSDPGEADSLPGPTPIVGIGASAGGLESLQQFLGAMPADSGAAFVVVQHLQHGRKSLMPAIIADFTRMPVVAAADGLRVNANTVYVLPADNLLSIHDGRLVLECWPDGEPRRSPIDEFFDSLAKDQERNAVAIVMSGAGSDGTLGVRAIKDHGGLAMAEALAEGRATAGFASMPASAWATGVVDFVLPVHQMPAQITEYAARLDEVFNTTSTNIESEAGKALPEIRQLLLDRKGRDFRDYKPNTLIRRTERRMQILHLDTAAAYLDRLRSDPTELERISSEFLIGVTRFFRDPEAFEALKTRVLRPIIAKREEGENLRIWVAGCSTGEEAYSVAILVQELRKALNSFLPVQIFATDIDRVAIDSARVGVYPESIAADVTPERLEGFFRHEDEHYRVHKEVRDLCIFSEHDITQDPPFCQMDLIVCRNFLIYLDSSFQKRFNPIIHYALREGGYLFLGASENVTQYRNLFAPVDESHRIFQRRDSVPRPQVSFPVPASVSAAHGGGSVALPPQPAFGQRIDRLVLERYAPPYVVADETFAVVHFSHGTGLFLEQPGGAPRSNLLDLITPALRSGVRTALYRAVQAQTETVQRDLVLSTQNGETRTDVVVTPFSEHDDRPYYLVVFNHRTENAPAERVGEPPTDMDSITPEHRVRTLERELTNTRADLQATIEELETSNEELQSANEELRSMNEELQSANEELQSSQQEVQSVNEELNQKLVELDRLNADLNNLLESTDIATLFLDEDYRIKWFAPATRRLFNLMDRDVGRPITDIATKFDDGKLPADLERALRDGRVHQSTVTLASEPATYTMRVHPYRTSEGAIAGAVITFQDITELTESGRRQNLLVAALQHRVRNILATVRSLARETREHSDSLDAFFERFDGRMRALATSETIVARTSEGVVDLFELVQEALPRDLHLGEQVSIAGPHLELAPRAGQMLALALNELATNAIKFGALAGDGAVQVSWSLADSHENDEIRITWAETGVVSLAPPDQRGFGLALIEEGLPYELGGSASVSFEPDGVRCRIAIPAARNLAPAPNTSGSAGGA